MGRIAGPFGVRGELKCDPTSAGRALLIAGALFACNKDGEATTVRIASARPHKGRLLIRIAGVDDLDAAQSYAGALLHAARERIELAPGEYLDDDLTGCRVFGVNGTDYGGVQRVEHYPASDMLIVGETMVPMVAAHVREIDIAARRIVIDPPAGLFDG